MKYSHDSGDSFSLSHFELGQSSYGLLSYFRVCFLVSYLGSRHGLFGSRDSLHELFGSRLLGLLFVSCLARLFSRSPDNTSYTSSLAELLMGLGDLLDGFLSCFGVLAFLLQGFLESLFGFGDLLFLLFNSYLESHLFGFGDLLLGFREDFSNFLEDGSGRLFALQRFPESLALRILLFTLSGLSGAPHLPDIFGSNEAHATRGEGSAFLDGSSGLSTGLGSYLSLESLLLGFLEDFLSFLGCHGSRLEYLLEGNSHLGDLLNDSLVDFGDLLNGFLDNLHDLFGSRLLGSLLDEALTDTQDIFVKGGGLHALFTAATLAAFVFPGDKATVGSETSLSIDVGSLLACVGCRTSLLADLTLNRSQATDKS